MKQTGRLAIGALAIFALTFSSWQARAEKVRVKYREPVDLITTPLSNWQFGEVDAMSLVHA